MKAIVKLLFVDRDGVIRLPGDAIELDKEALEGLGELVEAIKEPKKKKAE